MALVTGTRNSLCSPPSSVVAEEVDAISGSTSFTTTVCMETKYPSQSRSLSKSGNSVCLSDLQPFQLRKKHQERNTHTHTQNPEERTKPRRNKQTRNAQTRRQCWGVSLFSHVKGEFPVSLEPQLSAAKEIEHLLVVTEITEIKLVKTEGPIQWTTNTMCLPWANWPLLFQ